MSCDSVRRGSPDEPPAATDPSGRDRRRDASRDPGSLQDRRRLRAGRRLVAAHALVRYREQSRVAWLCVLGLAMATTLTSHEAVIGLPLLLVMGDVQSTRGAILRPDEVDGRRRSAGPDLPGVNSPTARPDSGTPCVRSAHAAASANTGDAAQSLAGERDPASRGGWPDACTHLALEPLERRHPTC